MEWFEAVLLGLIQGLTEFLPVSSSGHLEIGKVLLGVETTDDLLFTTMVHAATVLSTIVVFRKQIWGLLKGFFCGIKGLRVSDGKLVCNDQTDYLLKMVVSMIPVFVVGMFFKEQVEAFFGSGLLLVGICLCVTAILLYFSEWLSKRRAGLGHEVGYKDAIIIGLAQAVAVLPGLSRSGMTIATGLLCGVKKESVTKFSFLMVLIPILGEAFLELLDLLSGEVVSSLGVLPMVVGFLSAFISGCFACRFMINIVRRQKLIYFAIYCLCAGIFAIVYGLC
jgi:undecaprenyl-diphosphatase